MIVQDLVKNISEKLSASTHVNAVFGESRQIGRKTIIPIARVEMGFGAGGGEGKGEQRSEGECPVCEGSGAGGGGGAKGRPVALLEVTDEETKLIPVIDITRVVLASLAFATIATLAITKVIACKRK